MNELQVFNNDSFGQVRTLEKDGQPWFVAADVCRALELGNTAQSISRLDEDEKGIISNDTLGGMQEMSIVNEPGLYVLVLGSRKPEAKAFKRWITHEVIPAIRKHGAYMTPDKIEEVLLNPDTIITLATQLKEEREQRRKLQQTNSVLSEENQIMAPKAEYFDQLVDRNLLTNFRETARMLQLKPREFTDSLLRHKYVFRDKKGKLLPHSRHAEEGLFEVKECFNEKTDWAGPQTMITPKGRETFRLLLSA